MENAKGFGFKQLYVEYYGNKVVIVCGLITFFVPTTNDIHSLCKINLVKIVLHQKQ